MSTTQQQPTSLSLNLKSLSPSHVETFSERLHDCTGRPFTEIEKLVDVEEIDTDLYRSRALWIPIGVKPVYGGQVAGQALMAAVKTVPEKFVMHSFHSYFLLAGDGTKPIIFHVDRIRDGRSFATRFVCAKQNNQTIFTVTLSFQLPSSSQASHQMPMPRNVPHHSTLITQDENIDNMFNDPKVSSEILELLRLKKGEPEVFDLKDAHPFQLETIGTPLKRHYSHIWFKVKGSMGDTQSVHQSALGYIADYFLLNTVGLTYGVDWFGRRLTSKISRMASLDHSAWFHAPFRVDEWLLMVTNAPRSSDGRGLSSGRVYNEQGVMVASFAQEGVVKISAGLEKESKL